MTPADIRKLLAGYASGTLSEAERKVLFETALNDQALFDALADEEALRELLADAEVRGELLEALDEAEDTGTRSTVGPVYAKRAMSMQGEAGVQPLPAAAAISPAGLPGGTPMQTRPAPAAPPPAGVSHWWRLPMYGGLAAALAVGIFLLLRPEERQQVAQTRPPEVQAPSAPEIAPQSAPNTQRAEPLLSRRTSTPAEERQSSESAKKAEPPLSTGPVATDTVLSAPPRPPEVRQEFRTEAESSPQPQPMIAAAPPSSVPPPPPPAKAAIPAPAGVAAMKSADVAPAFTVAGRFRYRVEQRTAGGEWAAAPAQLRAGSELRLFITPPETGTVVAALPANRTEVINVLAGQPFTLPLSSSPGVLRVGLSLQTAQAETTPRARRLSRAQTRGGAASALPPPSDTEIRLEILP